MRAVSFRRGEDMRNRVFGGCAVAIGAMLAPFVFAPATAQGSSQQRTTVELGIFARHDSNIARSDEARAALRGLERSDERISPTLTVEIYRPVGQSSFSLVGDVGYDFHASNTQLDRERIGLTGGANIVSGICGVELSGDIRRRQTDLGDLAFFNAVPVTEVRNTENVLNGRARLICGSPYGLRPFVGAEFGRGRNSNVVRDRAEYDNERYTAGIQYNSPALGQISAFVDRTDVDLIGQILPDGSENGYRTTNIGLQYQREIGSRLRAQVRVAHTDVDPRSPLVPNLSGITWNGTLTATLADRVQLRGTIGREVTNSLGSDAVYGISRTYGLSATVAVNDRLRLRAGAQISPQTFRYGALPTGQFVDNDTRRIFSAGADYSLNRRLRLTLDGGIERRNANGTFFDYKNSYVGLGLVVSLGR